MNSTNDPHEDELREHLRTWGYDAEQRSPAFHRVWRGAQQSFEQRGTRPRSQSMNLAVIAATAVVCAAAIVWKRHPSAQAPVMEHPIVVVANAAPATASTFDPTAPTDFLLTATSGSDTPSVQQLTHEINALLTP
jgi:hypothetical protein